MALTKKETDALVAEALADIAALKSRTVPALRGVRRKLSARLKREDGGDVVKVARGLLAAGRRWMGWEIINLHPGALESLDLAAVEALGKGIDSWDSVDTFGTYVAGPAWQRGAVKDGAVKRWARSDDLWWRRTALVACVVLNTKSRGGTGDTKRTLAIASLLVDDREDMIVKAMSWALRSLAPWDAAAVRAFLKEHDARLAARVKRETRHKLDTGRKAPKYAKA